MLWVKTVHILFVMSWVAGIFYLPRIFVHFVEGQAAGEQVDRLAIMARKLYGFTTVMMVLALASGLALWLVYGFAGGWLHVKLAFVALLMVYHFWARARMKEMQQGRLQHGGVYYRWANEIPLILIIVILVMVVVKPQVIWWSIMAIVNISMDIGPWRSVNDGVMGGRSAGGMTQSIEGLKFEGRLSLENNGGFSSVRRLISQDISRATGVRIQVRGDGRQYQFFGRGLIGPIIWVARGEDIKLVDGGLQRRGFTDVSDGIAALVKIIENKDGIADSKIYNIGNPSNDLSIKELASLMLEMSYGIGWHMAHLLLE